ncbi:hypothetical protein [Nonomuraea soli]|uniref:Uncharacterized protein n=1 Tax=Nonomuraea soli TaxID=1032476 RepID=A0A7W0HVM5_9ACTN|nr:hypothetical protein [Nonomuraea soli]MBA2897399.1 hypothetical protein [Nonomuraea soli]
MPWPTDPLPVKVELQLGGIWTNVTSYTKLASDIVISRGRDDEASGLDHGKMTLSLLNTDGRFSPRNPTGPYYGLLGRNTPVRVSVLGGPTALEVDGTATSKATTPDNAAVSITGDLDVRLDVTLSSWRAETGLAGKWGTATNQRSWVLYLAQSGSLVFARSPDGTAGWPAQVSTVPVPIPASGRLAVRATIDVNNGASGFTVAFYTAPTMAGPWTQLGASVVVAGATSIFDSTAPIEVGEVDGLLPLGIAGRVHAFQLLNGIAGPAVANPDFTAQTPGAASFADAAGRTWTVSAPAEITNRIARYAGEISEWPSSWDLTGTDVEVSVEAAGIVRRLSQGVSPLESALRRAITRSTTNLVAYWPCEDGDQATELASGLVGGSPLRIVGTPDLASFTGFAASAPLPLLKGSEWSGTVPSYPVSQAVQTRWLLAVPAAGVGNQTLIRVRTSGSANIIHADYGTGGTLRVQVFNDSTVLADSGYQPFNVNGKLLRASLELFQNGANVDATLAIVPVGESTGSTVTVTATGRTLGQAKRVVVSPDGGIDDVAIGHVTVQSVVTTLFDLGAQSGGYVGETAGRRIQRLCLEEGVAHASVGDPDDTVPMGAQPVATFVDLLTEAAATDGGLLYETRERLGLTYRPRSARYNAAVALALSYPGGHISPPFKPTEDDADARNDITISRSGGSSARAVLESGPLSVQAPPAGIGRYDSGATINVRSDGQLPDHAWWRLHLGTWDEARYPRVGMDLNRNSALLQQVSALDSGDRITISHTLPWLAPGLVDLAVLGYTERLAAFEWGLEFNCSPARPYDVAVYGTGRYGSAGAQLAAGVNTVATSLSVATTLSPLWTTDAADMPFDIVIGGERMTVTAISGASSPQTFTVTRSVNGVVKAHLTGAKVDQFAVARYAL